MNVKNMGTLEIEEFEGGEAKRSDGPIRRREDGQQIRALSLAQRGPIDFGVEPPTRGSCGDISSLMNVWRALRCGVARRRTAEMVSPRQDHISEHDAKV